MKLHELNRGAADNRYCGPAVFSFLTGINTSDAAALFRKLYDLYRVRGFATRHMVGALRHVGIEAYHRPVEGKPTLAQWLKASKEQRTAGRVWLIVAGNHYQIVSGRKYACGRVGKIVGLSHKGIKKRARVEKVYEIIPNEDYKAHIAAAKRTIESMKTTQRTKSAADQTKRRRAHKIANEWGISIEVDDFGGGSKSIYFFAPEWLEALRDRGEIDFTTVAYDWDEAADVALEIECAIRDCQKKGLDIETVAA